MTKIVVPADGTTEGRKLMRILYTNDEEADLPLDVASGSTARNVTSGIDKEFDEKTEVWKVRSATAINNEDKTVTENGTYNPGAGYSGLGTVTVAIPLEESKTVTENGTILPSTGNTAMKEVVVNVQPNLQAKTITVSEAIAGVEIEPDEGYDGISKVTVVADPEPEP